MLFYYPVDFAERAAINESMLAGHQYLIVDFEATAYGHEAAIQRLRQEGHLVLVASIRNQVPPIIYTDSFQIEPSQLALWNYTTIDIYKIQNVTSVYAPRSPAEPRIKASYKPTLLAHLKRFFQDKTWLNEQKD